MPEFQMNGRNEPRFLELDSFTRGYIEALFFSETEPGTNWRTHDRQNDAALPATAGFGDLTPESLGKIKADCTLFQTRNQALLQEAYNRDYDPECAGRDFWFTRNGHGTGFWGRKELESKVDEAQTVGDVLSDHAHSFGVVDVEASDGRVHV